MGVQLPASLIALWRVQNGGGVASRFVELAVDGANHDVEVMRFQRSGWNDVAAPHESDLSPDAP